MEVIVPRSNPMVLLKPSVTKRDGWAIWKARPIAFWSSYSLVKLFFIPSRTGYIPLPAHCLVLRPPIISGMFRDVVIVARDGGKRMAGKLCRII
jgi:hypothetical protein